MDLPRRITGLSLFSGIGGIDIALSNWVAPLVYCEKDRYAQGVLLSRMSSGDLERAPIWDNVCTLDGKKLGAIDIIYGGFPCQDISVAGLGKGLGGERSGLFFEIIRLSKEIQPSFVFLENVPAIRTRGMDRVIEEFTQIGYDCRWCMLSAQQVGANHKRERWFLLAHSHGYEGGLQCESEGREAAPKFRNNGSEKPLAHSRCPQSRCENQTERPSIYIAGCSEDVGDPQHDGSHGAKIRGSSKKTVPNIKEGEDKAGEFEGAGKSSVLAAASIPNPSGKRPQGWELSQRREEKYTHFMHSCWWEVEPPVGRVVDELPSRVDRIKCLGNAVVSLQAKTAFMHLMGL